MPRSLGSAHSHVRLLRIVDQVLQPSACAGIGLKKVLVANRGEISVRICRAAKALGIKTVVIYTEQDDGAWHMKNPNVDEAVKLPPGATPIAPYLDIENIIRVCKSTGVDCVHPGYGFLAESAAFVARLKEEGIKFVGPSPECIEMFGDKTAARAHAQKMKVPVLPGSPLCRSVAEAEDFLKQQGTNIHWPVLIKAAFGGGGRGQKIVRDPQKFAESFDACSKEAELGFGDGGCFIEEYLENVRHIEIQLLGNGRGKCMTLFERDCSAQLRNQKVVEVAPARDMNPELRKQMCDAAIRLGEGCNYENAGTVEFLVSGSLGDANSRFVMLEVNPRIQVEHTITEEVTGADIAQTQFLIASGADFADIVKAGKLPEKPALNGFAFQLRITATPGGGPLKGYKEPCGRVDSGIVEGSTVSLEYDPLLAKLIVHSDSWESCRSLACERLAAFIIDGPNTNRKLLDGILNHPRFKNHEMYTNFIDANKDELEGKAKKKGATIGEILKIQPPFPGQIAEIKVDAGSSVEAGDVLAVVNAMKMLTDIVAPAPGIVKEVLIEANSQVMDETILFSFEVTGEAPDEEEEVSSLGAASVIGTLAGGNISGAGYTAPSWHVKEASALESSSPVIKSKIKTSDKMFNLRREVNLERVRLLEERLAEASMGGGEKSVQRHRSRGKKLPRERIADIIDPGTKFLELSALASFQKGDGKQHGAAIVTGIGLVHGRECMFIANDGTIGGGAFGPETLRKQDRAQAIALQNLMPTIYLVDGGGAKLDPQSLSSGIVPAGFVEGGRAFKTQALMSGKNIPQVAAVCGMCTAGAAYIPAMCDESVIVKGNGTVYLGGPPLVKAATGEDAEEQELGGGAMHTSQSGVVDHLAEDEPSALAMVRSIAEHFNTCTKFQPPGMRAPEPPKYDPEDLLGIIPEDNKIPFEMREVIARLVDGSRFHEFKPRFGSTLVCGFAHIEGYPVGILANNGMLFSQSALKGAHFIEVCGQRKIPLVFLHNITGFMIGTEFEKGGITKDGAKMITAVSCVQVPKFSIICGGSHGAGNYAMCGPAYDPRFTFLWPNAKISVMGGEQMVGTMAYVRAKAAARDGKAVDFEGTLKATMKMAAPMIEKYENLSDSYTSTANLHDDGIIDPRDTRSILARGLSIATNAMGNESIFPDKFGVFRM